MSLGGANDYQRFFMQFSIILKKFWKHTQEMNNDNYAKIILNKCISINSIPQFFKNIFNNQ